MSSDNAEDDENDDDRLNDNYSTGIMLVIVHDYYAIEEGKQGTAISSLRKLLHHKCCSKFISILTFLR